MKICNSHKVEFVHKSGVSKAGKTYDFWCCPEKLGNGDFCQDKGIEQGNYESVKSFEKSLGDDKNLQIFKCNAMNNAIAMVNAGIIADASLEPAFKRILAILTT